MFLVAARIYFWLAALGFPILVVHWCGYERRMSKRDYRTGWDDGWNQCVEDFSKLNQKPDAGEGGGG